MPLLIALAVIIGIIYWIYKIGGMGLILGIPAVIIAIYIYKKAEKRIGLEEEAKKKKEAQEAAQGVERRRIHKQNQEHWRQQLINSGSAAVSFYTNIPTMLIDSENLLDRAEFEFRDGAFSPFWEAIEAAVQNLGKIDSYINGIKHQAIEYNEAVIQFEGAVGSFPIDAHDTSRLDSLNKTNRRMILIVRQAQKNFQFATIFEQRRTTHVLIAGFQTLGEAIDGLGDRLTAALDGLSDQVRELNADQQARHSDMMSSLDSIVASAAAAAEQRDHIAAEATQQRGDVAAEIAQRTDEQMKQAEKTLAMLDNIQMRRKPTSNERGPRVF